MNDGWSQEENFGSRRRFEFPNYLSHHAAVSLQIHATWGLVEAMPDIVDSTRNRDNGGILIDDIPLQPRGHIGRLVSADASINNLDSQFGVETVKDFLHYCLVATEFSNTISQRNNPVAQLKAGSSQ